MNFYELLGLFYKGIRPKKIKLDNRIYELDWTGLVYYRDKKYKLIDDYDTTLILDYKIEIIEE